MKCKYCRNFKKKGLRHFCLIKADSFYAPGSYLITGIPEKAYVTANHECDADFINENDL